MRELRRAREIPIAVVALDTAINKATLSQAERGLVTLTEDQQKTLAKYYRVPKADLQRDAVSRAEVA